MGTPLGANDRLVLVLVLVLVVENSDREGTPLRADCEFIFDPPNAIEEGGAHGVHALPRF